MQGLDQMAILSVENSHIEGEVAGPSAGVSRSEPRGRPPFAHLIDSNLLGRKKHDTLLAYPVSSKIMVEVLLLKLILKIDLPRFAQLLRAAIDSP